MQHKVGLGIPVGTVYEHKIELAEIGLGKHPFGMVVDKRDVIGRDAPLSAPAPHAIGFRRERRDCRVLAAAFREDDGAQAAPSFERPPFRSDGPLKPTQHRLGQPVGALHTLAHLGCARPGRTPAGRQRGSPSSAVQRNRSVPSQGLGKRRAGVASALTDKSKLMEVRPHEEGSPQRTVAPRA